MMNLAKALSAAQSEIRHADKDGTNPHFKSSYSTLASVWDAARGPLTKNGLSVVQTQRVENDTIVSITTLMHSSGESISSELPLIMLKKDMQALGSAITYARRYQLAAIVGISSDDDDGESSMKRNDPDTYLIPFGQWKDKYLHEIPVPELKQYVAHIKKKSFDEQKPLTSVVSEFVNRVEKL